MGDTAGQGRAARPACPPSSAAPETREQDPILGALLTPEVWVALPGFRVSVPSWTSFRGPGQS